MGVRVPLHHPLVRQRLVHRGHVREEPSDVENLQAGAEGGSGQPFLIGVQLDRLSLAGLEPTDLATTKGFKARIPVYKSEANPTKLSASCFAK